MKTHYLTGMLYCLIATVSWGSMFPVMTSALRHLDPFSMTVLRYSLAGTAFLLLLLKREGWQALQLKGERVFLAWLFGTLGFAGFGFLVFLGQKMAGPDGALTASIVMATMPMLGMLAAWALRGTTPPVASLGFILLSFSGALLVVSKGDLASLMLAQHYSACIPLLLGALCWVIYTLGATWFPHWSPYRYTAITTLLGLTSIIGIDLFLLAGGWVPVPSISQVTAVAPHVLYIAIVPGFIGVLNWNLGNRIVTPLNGVLFMDVVPLTAFIISACTGVIPEPVQIVGTGITACALILNNVYQRMLAARGVHNTSVAQAQTSQMLRTSPTRLCTSGACPSARG